MESDWSAHPERGQLERSAVATTRSPIAMRLPPTAALLADDSLVEPVVLEQPERDEPELVVVADVQVAAVPDQDSVVEERCGQRDSDFDVLLVVEVERQ